MQLRHLQDQNGGTDDMRAFSLSDDVEVEAQPFACGSIAHLYKGVYKGKPVAVKVLRRGVLEDFSATMQFLATIQRCMVFCPSYFKRLGLEKFAVIVSSILETQLNFKNELENWKDMYKSCDANNIVIPFMYEELCTETVLVMDLVDGYSVYDVQKMPEAVIQEKAKELVRVFFRGLFTEGVIHADCHAGNLFWTKDGMRLGFYDFGIVQRVPKEMAQTFIKFYGSLFVGNIDAALDIMLTTFIEGYDDDRNAKSIMALQRAFRARMAKGVEEANIIKDISKFYFESKDITLRHDFTITNITFLNIDGILETMAHRVDIISIVKELMKEMIMANEIDLGANTK
jgi:predicted unusual protein kinase regulating ubiquinone biosynthesis (AarF/ABC1/UbiB family)